ncbi:MULTISPECIES: TraB/GumN family protein [Asticcacaulis]|uniref:TraB/GumN family protein n=1 Tax=Asticcacaulis TaxID=76890 RepID=UPI001AE89844|nr:MULTISPECIES: TraB/GumN family protein [Asticcacaulis]MBP2158053.1 uncharacterized protein YbaP (TraB family) [Asticcacaulis solisilvae]MDR6799098.1 uncharacterized protein YbaP (TraB family) [Asticcacaulis sp. BE141]
MAGTPEWVRDTCIGLLAGALAVMAWTALEPSDVTQRNVPVVLPAVMSADAREAVAGPTGAPLLWKVTNGEATVYLFGSVHALPPGVEWMDARLFQAFDTADAAWFEVPDLDKMPEFKGFEEKAFSARPGLTKGLSDIEIRELETLLHRYNSTLKEAERVRPAVMAAFVGQLSSAAGGFDTDRGVDWMLFNRAKALKMKTGGFESHRAHYDYLYALGKGADEGGTAALKRALAIHFGRDHDSLEVLVKTWRTGDQRAMTESLAEEKARGPQSYDLLLTSRNAKWVPQIETMLKGDQTTFVVAGAAHFTGPDSVIAMLRQRGYTVERVDP